VQLTMRAQSDNEAVATRGITPPELLRPDGVAVAEAGPQKATHHSSSSSRRTPVAAAPTTPKSEVVEILRGDRFEERKMRAKESE